MPFNNLELQKEEEDQATTCAWLCVLPISHKKTRSIRTSARCSALKLLDLYNDYVLWLPRSAPEMWNTRLFVPKRSLIAQRALQLYESAAVYLPHFLNIIQKVKRMLTHHTAAAVGRLFPVFPWEQPAVKRIFTYLTWAVLSDWNFSQNSPWRVLLDWLTLLCQTCLHTIHIVGTERLTV